MEMNLSDLSRERSQRLNMAQTSVLKQLSGQINWLASQCRTDVACENCVIGNSLTTSCVRYV